MVMVRDYFVVRVKVMVRDTIMTRVKVMSKYGNF